MPAYVIAHLRTPTVNAEVLDYIERVQSTMDPYGGRFLVHGAEVEVLEGEWPGTVVIVEFPDPAAAHAWYSSAAYREIQPWRTRHITGEVIVVAGVAPGYDARATADHLRRAT